MDIAILTLKKHLGDACRTAKVAINLEGGMGTEQVGIGAGTTLHLYLTTTGRLKQAFQELVSPVTIMQARPEIHLPGTGPAGTFIATTVEGVACCFSQCGCGDG